MTIQFTNKAHKDGFDKKSNLLHHKIQRIEHYHSTLFCLNLSAKVSLHSPSSLFSPCETHFYISYTIRITLLLFLCFRSFCSICQQISASKILLSFRPVPNLQKKFLTIKIRNFKL